MCLRPSDSNSEPGLPSGKSTRLNESKGLPSTRFRILRWVATAAFLFYLAWNLYWLLLGQVPPAIFYALTGYPSPTTGGTRAMICLANGQWQESLRYNAMAVPITLLLLTVLANVGWNRVRNGRIRMANWLWITLSVSLLIAWILKLTGNPAYW